MIEAKQKRDKQTRSIHRCMLRPIDLLGGCHEEHGSEFPHLNPLLCGLARPEDEYLTHLTDLLVSSHLPQQAIRALRNRRIA
jgi:hypothetical protein